jgi:hypothetical protein
LCCGVPTIHGGLLISTIGMPAHISKLHANNGFKEGKEFNRIQLLKINVTTILLTRPFLLCLQ